MMGTSRPRGACMAFLMFLATVHRVAGHTEECPTYYVNLDKSVDRRARVERLFGAFTNLHRVAGVDGHSKRAVLDVLSAEHCPPSSLPRSFDETNLGVRRGSSTYLSRLGCALSHVQAILRAHDDGREYALILEDDATPDLVPTWVGSLHSFVQTLPKDWTIVQLSALSYGDKLTDLFTQWQETRRDTREPSLTTLPKRAGSLIWSAQAYLVSREGMKQIAAKYRLPDGRLDICTASCVELDDCVLHEGVGENGYRIATPPLFAPRQDMSSTIGQTSVEAETGDETVAETDATRQMYEESRDVLYRWAGSWALNGWKRANLNMDPETLRDVMDTFVDIAGTAHSGLKTGSFAKAFRKHCEDETHSCVVEKAWLKNVVNPRDTSGLVEEKDAGAEPLRTRSRASTGHAKGRAKSKSKSTSKHERTMDVDIGKLGHRMELALLGDGLGDEQSAFARATLTPAMTGVLAACAASAFVALVAFAVERGHAPYSGEHTGETVSLLATAERGGLP